MLTGIHITLGLHSHAARRNMHAAGVAAMMRLGMLIGMLCMDEFRMHHAMGFMRMADARFRGRRDHDGGTAQNSQCEGGFCFSS